MENLEKGVFSFILSIFVVWGGQWLFFMILGFFPENTYINDIILFIYPPVLVIGAFIYFWRKKEKVIAISLLIGGGGYYLLYWFSIFLLASVTQCGRYFFNLLTNCPK